MNGISPLNAGDYFGTRLQKFQKLMPFKIRDILLVSSLYDSYLFEEDGRLYELIRKEYLGLNLNHSPELTHVSSGNDALQLLQEKNYDLIITTLHIEDMHVVRFAKAVREAGFNMPIVLLAYDNIERKDLVSNYDTSIFERLFIWEGDYRLIIGIVKSVEDRLNAEHDIKVMGVQSIILIEDNVLFYSSYLPMIYTEIFQQSQRLITEGLNLTHKFIRMRARPKILLCTNYDEAWAYFEKYSDYIMGVISDINFKRNGVKDPEAGIKFAQNVKATYGDIPVLLQSSNKSHAETARRIGASFIVKDSPRLLNELREFMVENLGFGDFTFRTADGTEVARANNLKSLQEKLEIVPEESIVYHASRNNFSNWLKARTEFWLAHKLRPRKVSDFATVEDLRKNLINTLKQYLELRTRGIITDFSPETFDIKNSFSRIGGGSLGGKARGLGFVNHIITNFDFADRFHGVKIFVPSAVVLGTEVFDQFLEENDLLNFAFSTKNDDELDQRFLESKNFPKEVRKKLQQFLDIVKVPLAVRSSSLLEDSQFQPFAGVYRTYMIPNENESLTVRLHQLISCIKLVYASTYHKSSKDYMRASPYRLEEEKMAVIIQVMVGSLRNEGRFYPDFAGVAKSYNFYPVSPQSSSDGIAYVALGLGKQVVEGGNAVRFCPKYPRHLLQFYSTQETIKNAQQEFFALDLSQKSTKKKKPVYHQDEVLKTYSLQKAENDGTLYLAGSTYSAENDSVYDGISRPGLRIVTFAPVLKHKIFPLPEVLESILNMGRWGMGTQVEIEFAVNLKVSEGEKKEFGILQMRPMVLSSEAEELDLNSLNENDIIVESPQVLGNGVIRNIFDIVVVDIEKFDRSKSREVAAEIGMLNSQLLNENRPYLLIGVGRWGSLDPWLGIPVTWDQISGASAIVESGFKDFNVIPSQGSHFFQNLTSFRIAYFTVNSFYNQGRIDWEWLNSQKIYKELKYSKILRYDEPFIVKINGHKNKGAVIKPGIQA